MDFIVLILYYSLRLCVSARTPDPVLWKILNTNLEKILAFKHNTVMFGLIL